MFAFLFSCASFGKYITDFDHNSIIKLRKFIKFQTDYDLCISVLCFRFKCIMIDTFLELNFFQNPPFALTKSNNGKWNSFKMLHSKILLTFLLAMRNKINEEIIFYLLNIL